jgi:hypothetical protein
MRRLRAGFHRKLIASKFSGHICWPRFLPAKFLPGFVPAAQNEQKRVSGGITQSERMTTKIRPLKKAQEATGQASASKTFMTAILELQRNRDEMAATA